MLGQASSDNCRDQPQHLVSVIAPPVLHIGIRLWGAALLNILEDVEKGRATYADINNLVSEYLIANVYA